MTARGLAVIVVLILAAVAVVVATAFNVLHRSVFSAPVIIIQAQKAPSLTRNTDWRDFVFADRTRKFKSKRRNATKLLKRPRCTFQGDSSSQTSC